MVPPSHPQNRDRTLTPGCKLLRAQLYFSALPRLPSRSQGPWIHPDLYLADFNSEVAFGLHPEEQEIPALAAVRACGLKGSLENGFLAKLIAI